MTLTFFGRSISPHSTAGKLILFVGFPLVVLLTGYSCYLGTVAIGAELNVPALVVFVVLVALMTELTFDGRKTGLLPSKFSRDILGWACFAISLYHYVRLDMRLEVILVSLSVLLVLVTRLVKLITSHRDDQWQLKRAKQVEMVDMKYGNRSDS
jgi:hypothetical protein